MTVDRTPRPCLHPRARHEHGTRLGYVLDGCRCLPCAAANSAYETRRLRLKAYGRPTPTGLVDAEPVRAHVRELQAAGLGHKRVARLAGVTPSTVGRLLYGRSRHGVHEAPSKRIRPDEAARLLAVPLPTLDVMGGKAVIDGTGTRRRLQALVALGWSQNHLAARLGIMSTNMPVHIRAERVTVRLARAVRELYDELSLAAPVARDRWDAGGITRAKRHAARQRWAPPLAWDDESIDDPAAKPNRGAGLRRAEGRAFDEVAVQRALHGDRVPLHHSERAEAVRRLAALGYSDARIAERLGVSERTALRLRREPSGQETA